MNKIAMAQFLLNNILRFSLALRRTKVLKGKNATQLNTAINSFREINTELEDQVLEDNAAYRDAELLSGND